MTVWEITTWPASEEFKKDVTIIDPAARVTAGPKGPESFYAGVEFFPGSTNTFLTIVHAAFRLSEKLAQFAAAVQVTRAPGGDLEIAHAHFPADPKPLLGAPVTEYLWITPKEGLKDEVAAFIDTLVASLNDPATPAVGGTYAPLVERPDTFIMLAGWPSLEANQSATKLSPLKEIIPELLGKSSVKLSFAKLRHVEL
ncbi:hypothetical protein BV25DRAFT_1504494 [Artomyces pyxidatus]|uniref:Uncharacterized protein n=1 Tax=Artomyces pyxidatus TaxID=48021 RepID=A0ACB8TC43_9AGAM|nr:hypothetical protein BV25DRAFT_1504494 [Artomyces pyxidatus]